MNVDTEDTPIETYTYVVEGSGEVVKSLSPISHEHEEGMYRVPVRIEGEKHTIYVGDNHTRMFDADTLPAFIKHKLAMIIVSATPESVFKCDDFLSKLDLYATPKTGNLQTIGWRASETMYIVVMSEEELTSLIGK
jgi:hypothetical protein